MPRLSFLTSFGKFCQINIFCELNNLQNIRMFPSNLSAIPRLGKGFPYQLTDLKFFVPNTVSF